MTDRHEHLDEGTIHAWLDEALPPDEAARVESTVTSCAECAARVAEARGLIAASSRILSSLDAVPGGVIPGAPANLDQLAALRARRSASRRWWQDRRVAIAASLVLVAGVSSLVMRRSPNESIPLAAVPAETMMVAPPPASLPAPVPEVANTAPVATRETVRDAKVAAAPPSRGAATPPPVDSPAFAQKVTPAPAPAPAVASETRQRTADIGRVATDSLALSRREATVAERQLRQEGSPRQAVQQFRADSIQRAAAPAALGTGLRRGAVTSSGFGAAMADAAGPGAACYRLRGLTAPGVTDTIRLLNAQAPVLSDPSWFRTQFFGALRDTTLAWRSVDSVTVELRSRFGSDTTAVRFRADGAVEGLAPPNVRVAFAERVGCPR